MRTSAGRILIIPKGDYNSIKPYFQLDFVRHNKAGWLCKKECTGVEPSEANPEFWMLVTLDGEKGADGDGAQNVDLTPINAKIAELEESNGTLSTGLNEVRTDLGNKAESNHTHSEIAELSTEVDNVKTELGNKAPSDHTHSEISELSTEVNGVKESISDLNTKNEELSNSIKFTNIVLNDVSKNCTEVSKESSLTNDKISELSTEVNNVKTELGNKASSDHTHSEISELSTEVNTMKENINKRNVYEGILYTGNTQVSINISGLTNDSIVDIYTSVYGVSPKNVTVSGETLVLDFLAQSTEVKVKAVIS